MDLVPAVLIPVAVPIVLGLLVGAANPVAEVVAGKTTLKYGWAFKSFGLFFSALALCILAGLPFVKPADRIWIVALSLLFAVLSAPLILSAFLVRVTFSEEGIEAYSPWRKARNIPWSGVVRLRYSYRAHIIDTRDNGKVKLPDMMSGVASMIDEVRRRKIPYV